MFSIQSRKHYEKVLGNSKLFSPCSADAETDEDEQEQEMNALDKTVRLNSGVGAVEDGIGQKLDTDVSTPPKRITHQELGDAEAIF